MPIYYFPKTYIEAVDRLIGQYERFVATGRKSCFPMTLDGSITCPLCTANRRPGCRACPNVIISGKECFGQASYQRNRLYSLNLTAKDDAGMARRRLAIWRKRRAKMRVWKNPPRDWWKHSKKTEG